jgi:AraC-like DNA-binding protein
MNRLFKILFFTTCLLFIISILNDTQQFVIAQNHSYELQEKLKQLYKIYTETYKDSLKHGEKYAREALNISREIKDHVNEINALIYLGRADNICNKLSEAKFYLYQAVNLARQQGNKYLEARSSIALGFTYYCLQMPDSSLYFAKRGYEIALLLRHKELLELATVRLANGYFINGDKSNALKYCRDALERNKNNKRNLAETYQQMGLIYSDIGDFEKSLKNYSTALELFKELNEWATVAYVYSSIAGIFGSYSDVYKCADYNLKALEIFRKLKDYRGMGYVLNSLGIVQHESKNYKLALKYFQESLAKKKQTEDKQGMIFTLNNISTIYLNNNRLDSAYRNINLALKYSGELKDKLSFMNSYELLGEYYMKIRKYPEAFAAIDNSMKYAREINYRPMIEIIYGRLSDLYNETGDKQNAFYYLRQKNTLRDSINTEKSRKYIADVLVKYETEDKENQLKQLNEKRVGLESESAYQRILIWIIIIISISAISILLYFYRRKVVAFIKVIKIIPKRANEDKRRLKGMMRVIDQRPEQTHPKEIDLNITDDLIFKLNKLMVNEKMFLNPQIKQAEVAKKLNTNTAYLSRIINDQLSSNFSDYINRFRINEAKKMILNNRQNNFTFEGIAQSVGFRSKSAFNLAFKKFTGKTPSQFAVEGNSATPSLS